MAKINPMNKLKYLFTVEYKDGSKFYQNEEDTSKTREGGSSFSDVVLDEVKTFTLIEYKEGSSNRHTYMVSMEDGHFEIDGIPFFMTDKPLKDFRLIFFRVHNQSMNVRVSDKKVLAIQDEVVYRIGWQCTVGGKNYQEVMQIK